MPSTEVLRTDRGDFQALVDGPDDGPLVLLLHGFPELNVSWRAQIPALAAQGWRVVAPNQRGYAGSVSGGSYATADLAADVVAMIDALGADRAAVVGHDWGGGVAWTVAGLHPDRVSALVAMNCPPPTVLARHLLRSPGQLRKSWYMVFFQLPILPERFVARRMPGMLVAGSFNRKAWNRTSLEPYAAAFGTPEQLTGPINWYRAALRAGLRGSLPRVRPISCPVLVIWGLHDRFLGQEMVSPQSLRAVLAYGTAADVVEIPSSGHFVQNEAPQAVNEALTAWLAAHADHVGPSGPASPA